jgi:hypothetical protein
MTWSYVSDILILGVGGRFDTVEWVVKWVCGEDEASFKEDGWWRMEVTCSLEVHRLLHLARQGLENSSPTQRR